MSDKPSIFATIGATAPKPRPIFGGEARSSESFTVSGHTASMLVELQKAFGVTTNAEVIRKALALANLASQKAGSDHTITITSDDGKPPVKISLVE